MTNLTDKIVRDAPTPRRGAQIKIYDERLPGFGIRVTSTGARSFIFNYIACGRERRLTIGSYPAWSVAAARERVSKLRRQVDAGDDPLAEKARLRTRMTMKEGWKRYEQEILPRKAASTAIDEQSMWKRLILPSLGEKLLVHVSHDDIDALHRAVSCRTPVQANRCVVSLRHFFNIATRWGEVDANPAIGSNKNPETPRERYLTAAELNSFRLALTARPVTPSTLAIQFLLTTGARRGEVLNARWDQFDLVAGVWTKPSAHTKQRRVHRVPLSTDAINTLLTARQLSAGDVVFAGRTGVALVEIKKVFKAVCVEAGITKFRIHDLRHSYASILASHGVSLPIIGSLLGHTQASTTMRYSHLADDPLRLATQIASDKISAR